ncbi:unnamed protein product [Amoebophrya sp. A120]|nr:unnamed protein product [Amoebophrya sp. A120]|eukprot:GSA120T00004233001.1
MSLLTDADEKTPAMREQVTKPSAAPSLEQDASETASRAGGSGAETKSDTEVDVGVTENETAGNKSNPCVLMEDILQMYGGLDEKTNEFKNDFVFLADDKQLWNASVVLLRYLQKQYPESSWKGKKILELGSGLGHLAFALAQLGADVTCTEQPKCVPVLQDSLDKQAKETERRRKMQSDDTVEPARVPKVRTLKWGDVAAFEELCSATQKAPSSSSDFDLVICSEIFYDENVHDDLVATWRLIAEKFGPTVEFYSIFINRPFSWNFFAKLDDSDSVDDADGESGARGASSVKFHVASVHDDKIDFLGLDDVHMHHTTVEVRKDEDKNSIVKSAPDATVTPSTTKDDNSGGLLLDSDEDPKTGGQQLAGTENATDENKLSQEEEEKTVWEILDELIGIAPDKLRIYVQCALLILAGIAILLIQQASEAGEQHLVYLHGGFLFCVVMLSLSVEFVLAEAGRLMREKELADEEKKKEK